MSVIPTATFQWTPQKFMATLSKAVNAGLTSAAIAAQGKVRAGMTRAGRFSASSPGRPPNIRRGALTRSIRANPSRNFRSSVSANISYARIHEQGGVIRAKKGALPVPLNVAAQIMLETSPQGLRSRNLVLIRSKRGNKVLISKDNVKSKRGGMTTNARAAFVLRRSVTMPPRPFLTPGVFGNREAITDAALRTARNVMKAAVMGGKR